uniref:Uncharacterized protein n=1 Tax=Proboscia inermis TaxID=420281 RepID=A0A7S0GKK5_9STRA
MDADAPPCHWICNRCNWIHVSQNETSFLEAGEIRRKLAHYDHELTIPHIHPTIGSNTKGRILAMEEIGTHFVGFTAWKPVTSFLVCIWRAERVSVHAHKYLIKGKKRASKAAKIVDRKYHIQIF